MSACEKDFVEHTRHLFVDVAQGSDIAGGERPARRAVFRKLHGVVHGRMILDITAPKELRQGIFSGSAYEAWIRFSSDVAPNAPDSRNGTIGIGIKLFGVAGPTLAATDPQSPTVDLLLQNHDVFFVDTGFDMCVFTDLALKGRIEEWFAAHPETRTILADMAKHEESVLTATYWSVLPYACGSGMAVKYRLKPLSTGNSAQGNSDPDRLRADLAAHLATGGAAFDVQIQRREPGSALPVDRATQRWDELEAPFVNVGRLEIAQQDVGIEGQQAYGESLAFSPWRAPEANRPLGTIAESRRAAYPSSAARRHYINGLPDAEPHSPRPPVPPKTD